MVGECLRNNTTLMLSLYLSLSSYTALLCCNWGMGGQQNWGCWLPWCLQSSDGVHRCSKLLPVVEPKGFSPDPHVNHQLHSQSPHPSNLKTAREKGAGKDEEKQKAKEDACVFVCGFLSHWQRFFCWEPRQRWVVLLFHSRTRWAFLHQTQKCSRCHHHHHQLVLAHSSCLPSEPEAAAAAQLHPNNYKEKKKKKKIENKGKLQDEN